MKAVNDSGCDHCDLFLRMKAVMIFLVLTLVVVMAEAQSYGPITNSGNTGTTGGKSQVFIQTELMLTD